SLLGGNSPSCCRNPGSHSLIDHCGNQPGVQVSLLQTHQKTNKIFIKPCEMLVFMVFIANSIDLYPIHFMRIKEIATILGAGILSLAAVMILESETTPLAVASETAPATEFEDTSSLIEYAPPAPTAEPPASADKED